MLTQLVFGQKTKKPYYETTKPPGTIRIDTNLYIDQTEITNFYYLEYMFWVERIFGSKSKHWQELRLDTLVWREIPYEPFVEFYLRHPFYRDYPVIGITQKQAELFNKWRSDRVMELLLIKYAQIETRFDQDSLNYFSIENYFKGKYFDYVPNFEYKIYPEYSLPTESEWNVGKEYFEKNNKVKKCNKKYCPLHFEKGDTLMIMYDVNPYRKDSTEFLPTEAVRCYNNPNLGTHFYGNVSEWLKEENMIIGGNWRDTSTTHFNQPIKNEYPENYVGFRSVCRWKEYKLE